MVVVVAIDVGAELSWDKGEKDGRETGEEE